jgi:hypothetical protein
VYGWVGAERVRRTLLCDLPEVHHRDAVAHVAHDGEVVGDEEGTRAESVLEVFEQVDRLRLSRDVGALTGSSITTSFGSVASANVPALELAADGSRYRSRCSRRGRRGSISSSARVAVDLGRHCARKGSICALEHRRLRVERGVRVLEELHVGPQRPSAPPFASVMSLPSKNCATRSAPSAQHQPRDRALPRSRLPHQAERAAASKKSTPSTGGRGPSPDGALRFSGKCCEPSVQDLPGARPSLIPSVTALIRAHRRLELGRAHTPDLAARRRRE